MDRTINAKPAAALFGGQVAVLVIGLLNRYTSYNPSVDEATSIVGLAAFAAAWLVPERYWKRALDEDSVPDSTEV